MPNGSLVSGILGAEADAAIAAPLAELHGDLDALDGAGVIDEAVEHGGLGSLGGEHRLGHRDGHQPGTAKRVH